MQKQFLVCELYKNVLWAGFGYGPQLANPCFELLSFGMVCYTVIAN